MSDKFKIKKSFRDNVQESKISKEKEEAERKQAQQEVSQKLLTASKEVIEESKKLAKTMPERLALLCDCSGSMASYAGAPKDDKPKIEFLRLACENFLDRINFYETSVMLRTFPELREDDETSAVFTVEEKKNFFGEPSTTYIKCVGTPLLCNHFLISLAIKKLRPYGGTPLGECLNKIGSIEVEQNLLTRAIIISDGEATDQVFANSDSYGYDEYSITNKNHSYQSFIHHKIPIDCVHIGQSSSGEETLKRITKATGGVYMKFEDVSKFSQALHYLTPGYRGLLTSGEVNATQLGAKEIK